VLAECSHEEVLETVRRRAERMNLPSEIRGEVVDDIRVARDERAGEVERLVGGET
jgi:hypothetical protein